MQHASAKRAFLLIPWIFIRHSFILSRWVDFLQHCICNLYMYNVYVYNYNIMIGVLRCIRRLSGQNWRRLWTVAHLVIILHCFFSPNWMELFFSAKKIIPLLEYKLLILLNLGWICMAYKWDKVYTKITFFGLHVIWHSEF